MRLGQRIRDQRIGVPDDPVALLARVNALSWSIRDSLGTWLRTARTWRSALLGSTPLSTA
jgi:hypothetical protein